MNWFEDVLILVGISLDIFATMVIQGSMLPDIKKKTLLIACGIVLLFQNVFFFGGYVICYLLANNGYIEDPVNNGEICASVVFLILGVRLLVKAIRSEFVNERRKDGIKLKELMRTVVITSLYTLAAGCTFGLVSTPALSLLLILIVTTVLVVIGGIYTGMHFGFENKTIVYTIGTILLWVAGAEILLTKVLGIF